MTGFSPPAPTTRCQWARSPGEPRRQRCSSSSDSRGLVHLDCSRLQELGSISSEVLSMARSNDGSVFLAAMGVLFECSIDALNPGYETVHHLVPLVETVSFSLQFVIAHVWSSVKRSTSSRRIVLHACTGPTRVDEPSLTVTCSVEIKSSAINFRTHQKWATVLGPTGRPIQRPACPILPS